MIRKKWVLIFSKFTSYEKVKVYKIDEKPCQSLQCLRSDSKDWSSPPCSLHTFNQSINQSLNTINIINQSINQIHYQTINRFFLVIVTDEEFKICSYFSSFHVPFPSMIVFLTARHWEMKLFSVLSSKEIVNLYLEVIFVKNSISIIVVHISEINHFHRDQYFNYIQYSIFQYSNWPDNEFDPVFPTVCHFCESEKSFVRF